MAESRTTPGRIGSPGWWLQLVGLVHGGVGLVVYRRPLADVARARVVGAVPEWGDRATAFWFVAAAPAVWVSGRLLRSAERTEDRGAERSAGAALLALGAVGSAAMPASGFWGVAAIGLATLWRGRRRGR